MLSVVPLLILVIVPGVQLFLSSDPSTVSTDRTIIRFAQCYLTVFVSFQVPTVVGVWIVYFFNSKKQSGIAGGEVTIRAVIIFVVASLLTWIQAVKILQTFYTPTSETAVDPPWFLRRPILYSGLFLPELLCVITYVVSSIRLRFLKPVRDGVEKETNNVGDTGDDTRTVTPGSEDRNFEKLESPMEHF